MTSLLYINPIPEKSTFYSSNTITTLLLLLFMIITVVIKMCTYSGIRIWKREYTVINTAFKTRKREWEKVECSMLMT